MWLSGLPGCGSLVTLVFALTLSSPDMVVVLNSASPVFAMAYLHEQITPRVALGIALSVGGNALSLLQGLVIGIRRG